MISIVFGYKFYNLNWLMRPAVREHCQYGRFVVSGFPKQETQGFNCRAKQQSEALFDNGKAVPGRANISLPEFISNCRGINLGKVIRVYVQQAKYNQ
jgi:hypothetical protein